jgi:hypothetical protein
VLYSTCICLQEAGRKRQLIMTSSTRLAASQVVAAVITGTQYSDSRYIVYRAT